MSAVATVPMRGEGGGNNINSTGRFSHWQTTTFTLRPPGGQSIPWGDLTGFEFHRGSVPDDPVKFTSVEIYGISAAAPGGQVECAARGSAFQVKFTFLRRIRSITLIHVHRTLTCQQQGRHQQGGVG